MSSTGQPGDAGFVGPDWRNRSRLAYSTVRLIVSLIVWSRLIRLRVIGAEHVSGGGAAILMSNHQSNLDPVLIGWPISRPISIPGKKELFAVPLLGWLLGRLGSFPVDRETADAASLRHSVRVLRSGGMLCVFPEATRTRTGGIGAFQSTLTKLASRFKAPVIPVAIEGSGNVLGRGQIVPRFFSRIVICYGEELTLEDLYDYDPSDMELERATERIRHKVIALAARARQELAAMEKGEK